MLIVKTKILQSPIEGIGLFAAEDIKKGTMIGMNDKAVNKYSSEEWESLKKELSEESFRQVKKYSYKNDEEQVYFLCLDDTRFINHSKNPNIETVGNCDFAIRDIKKDEEIVIDYTAFIDPNDEDTFKEEAYLRS